MKKILKRTAYAFVGLFTIILIVVVGFLATFNPNDWVEEISEATYEATGFDLAFGAAMEFELSLHPHLVLNKISLNNEAAGQAAQLIQMDRLELRLDILALLTGQLDIEKFDINKLNIQIARLENGRLNVEPVKKDKASETDAAETSDDHEDSSVRKGNVFLELPIIRDLAIRNVTIDYSDPQNNHNRHLVLNELILQGKTTEGAEAKSQPLAFKLNAIVDQIPLQLSGHLGAPESIIDEAIAWLVNIQGQVAGMDVVLDGYIQDPQTLSGIDLKLDLAGRELSELLALTGKTLPPFGAYQVALEVQGSLEDGLDINQININAGHKQQLLADIRGNAIKLKPTKGLDGIGEAALQIKLVSDGVSRLNPFLKAFGLPDVPALGPMNISSSLSTTQAGWNLNEVLVKLGSPVIALVDAQGQFKGEWPAKLNSGQFSLAVRGTEVAKLLPYAQPYISTPIPPLQGRVNVELEIEAENNKISMPKLVVNFGKNGPLQLSLDGQVTSLTAVEPYVQGLDFNLAVDIAKLSKLNKLISHYTADVKAPALGSLALKMKLAQTASGRIDARDIQLNIGQGKPLKLTATAAIEDLMGGRDITLASDIKVTDLKQLKAHLNKALKQPVDFPAFGNLSAGFKLEGTMEQGFEIPEFKVDLNQKSVLDISLAGRIAKLAPQDENVISGVEVAVNLAIQQLERLGEAIKVELPAMKPIQLSANINLPSSQKATVDITNLMVGDSDMKGNIDADLRGLVPAIKAVLTSKRLIIDHLIPQQGSKKKSSLAAGSGGSSSAGGRNNGRIIPKEPLPLEGLKLAEVDLSIQSNAISYNNNLIGQGDIVLSLHKGDARLERALIKTADGQFEARASLLGQVKPVLLEIWAQSRNLDAASILPLAGLSPVVRGPLIIDVDLRSNGGNPRELAANLTGNLELSLLDGKLDMDLLKREIGAASPIVNLVFGNSRGLQDLYCLSSSMTFKQGLGTLDSLAMKTAPISLIGGGDVNMRNEQLNLNFKPKANIAGLQASVPVSVAGTFANPDIQAKTSQALAGVLSNFLGGAVPGLNQALGQDDGDNKQLGKCLNDVMQSVNAPAASQQQENTPSSPAGIIGDLLKGKKTDPKEAIEGLIKGGLKGLFQ